MNPVEIINKTSYSLILTTTKKFFSEAKQLTYSAGSIQFDKHLFIVKGVNKILKEIV